MAIRTASTAQSFEMVGEQRKAYGHARTPIERGNIEGETLLWWGGECYAKGGDFGLWGLTAVISGPEAVVRELATAWVDGGEAPAERLHRLQEEVLGPVAELTTTMPETCMCGGLWRWTRPSGDGVRIRQCDRCGAILTRSGKFIPNATPHEGEHDERQGDEGQLQAGGQPGQL